METKCQRSIITAVMGRARIPVIDLFAGPGGLGEGFASFGWAEGQPGFKIALSVEMESSAHRTLTLRAFYRQFDPNHVPSTYYDVLRGRASAPELFERYPVAAQAAGNEAWQATLGVESPKCVNTRIQQALSGAEEWVLIGGPPCQAYSLAGRSRNKGKEGYKPKEDARHFLYLQYLQIIAHHRPAVFVMENVKGLLSATVENERMFDRIRRDLQDPNDALCRENLPKAKGAPRYVIRSLNSAGLYGPDSVADFIVRCERHGVPQRRHRVILLGVREDLSRHPSDVLPVVSPRTLRDVLGTLPALRSGLTEHDDSGAAWCGAVQSIAAHDWFKELRKCNDQTVREATKRLGSVCEPTHKRGGEFLECDPGPCCNRAWYLDHKIGGVCNHSARAHMDSDLHRYAFASLFALRNGRSPGLGDFPDTLLPAHLNVHQALTGAMFADRFRVQLWDCPSTTVVSHIAKDGHYYIHPDPVQCRSLTVREAARLQTFPDNYFFCGNRTQQYHQVGNAVPPYIANQIARIVYDLLRQ